MTPSIPDIRPEANKARPSRTTMRLCRLFCRYLAAKNVSSDLTTEKLRTRYAAKKAKNVKYVLLIRNRPGTVRNENCRKTLKLYWICTGRNPEVARICIAHTSLLFGPSQYHAGISPRCRSGSGSYSTPHHFARRRTRTQKEASMSIRNLVWRLNRAVA